jgi:hypothetical protein
VVLVTIMACLGHRSSQVRSDGVECYTEQGSNKNQCSFKYSEKMGTKHSRPSRHIKGL